MKQKKNPGQSKAPATGERSSQQPDVDASMVEAASLGNAALLAGMGAGAEEVFGVELDVRDLAMPKVGRAVLAMEMLPRPTAQTDRMLAIIEGSNLSGERKDLLTDRLERDIDAASDISAAIERAFGEDTAAVRGELISALEAVWSGLQAGSMNEGTWQSADGAQHTIEGESAGDRADALIAVLAGERITGDLASGDKAASGKALTSLVNAVSLALMMDEEEEEEEEAGDWGGEP